MTGHQYGPHDESTAPNAVVILTPGVTRTGRWPEELVVPMPEELRRQRRDMNNLAHEAGRDE